MLVIRNEQMKALFFGMAGPYRATARAAMRKSYPAECTDLGDRGLEQMIMLSLEKAWLYGIEEDEDILLYLDVMFRAGYRFDEEPQHAWAREILRDKSFAVETRVDLIHQRFAAMQAAGEV